MVLHHNCRFYAIAINIQLLKTSQLKTVCKDDSDYITQLKQQKSKRWYYV